MPVYSFRCRKCGKEYEALVKKAGDKAPCPTCGDKHPQKQFSLIAALFGRAATRSSDGGCGAGGGTGFR